MLKLFVSRLITTMPLFSQATEEPGYDVVQQLDGAEIRQYAPYVVAQVLVSGPADKAGNQAFPILAGYIFGKNKGARKFDMTAPVTRAAAASVRLEMTAPVTQAATADDHAIEFSKSLPPVCCGGCHGSAGVWLCLTNASPSAKPWG